MSDWASVIIFLAGALTGGLIGLIAGTIAGVTMTDKPRPDPQPYQEYREWPEH